MFTVRVSRFTTLLLAIAGLAMLMVLPGVSAQVAQSVELVGMVEAMTANTITVNQQEVITTGAALNTQLVIGALVKVEGTLNGDGSIAARQISAAATGVVPGEAELEGVIESINGALLTIQGQTIDTTGAQISGALAVGQRVRIHASPTAPNTWRAREVEAVMPDPAVPQPPIAGEFEIVGTLQSISGGMMVISGQSISFVNAELKTPLVVGALVKVHVTNINGVLTAREVELAFSDDLGEDNANGNANANANANMNTNANSNDNSDDNGNDNSNANVSIVPPFTVEQALAEVARVYPNAQVRSIELTTRFGGTLVWEIKISGRIEVILDAQTGAILVIDRAGSSSGGGSGSANGNANGSDDGGNGNSNEDGGNDNGNSNDDGGNSNSGNSNSDDGGMGGDDGGGDDNSGMG